MRMKMREKDREAGRGREGQSDTERERAQYPCGNHCEIVLALVVEQSLFASRRIAVQQRTNKVDDLIERGTKTKDR